LKVEQFEKAKRLEREIEKAKETIIRINSLGLQATVRLFPKDSQTGCVCFYAEESQGIIQGIIDEKAAQLKALLDEFEAL